MSNRGNGSCPPPSYRSGANVLLATLEDDIRYDEVDLVADDGGMSRGLLYRPSGRQPKVGVHLMHPRTDQSRNYNIAPLVRAGYAVLGRAGRWVNNDIATEHERLLLDVAAGIQLLRDKGCETVILLGNSGGGSLACFYQAQAACAPPSRLTHTACGDPFDLNAMDLPSASGVVLIGAHLGEGACLKKWLDASVVDESEPDSCDPSLDMYDAANGFQMPPEPSRYSTEFIDRVRTAQRARVERLDARARELLDGTRRARSAAHSSDARSARRGARVDHMIIPRTMADPAFCDLSIEPDDRTVAAYNNNPRPDLVNWGQGVAAVLHPQAWLSTWSGLSTRASTVDNLRSVTVPVLVVHYAGDSITRLGEAQQMADASSSAETSLVVVRHTDHYGYAIDADGTRGQRTAEGTGAAVAWLQERFPAA